MDKDYQNFVDRMGSFEDNINMSDDDSEIEHTGVLGMKWGKRKGRASQKLAKSFVGSTNKNVKRTKKFVDNKLEKRAKRAQEWVNEMLADNRKMSELTSNTANSSPSTKMLGEMMAQDYINQQKITQQVVHNVLKDR